MNMTIEIQDGELYLNDSGNKTKICDFDKKTIQLIYDLTDRVDIPSTTDNEDTSSVEFIKNALRSYISSKSGDILSIWE